MQNTKKIAIFALSALVLAGGVYIFRDSAIFDGLSSSVLNTSFTCTESALQSESAAYRQTNVRYKKALVLQKNLESEIAQMISTISGEVQKKQDALKILKRQIGIYTRFIKKYDTCKREVNLQPIVSPGIMSGEARILPSLPNEYQELIGVEISSPENLDTFMNTLQFHVRITPAQSITIDQWFLTTDASTASPCQSSQSGDIVTLDCDMFGGIPASIPSTTKNTYRLGAHIISVDQTVEGSIEMSVIGMTFNDGREGFENKTTPSILQYGILPGVPQIILPETISVDAPAILPTVAEIIVAAPPVIDQVVDPTAEIPPVDILQETSENTIVPVLDAGTSADVAPLDDRGIPSSVDESPVLPPADVAPPLDTGTVPVSSEVPSDPEPNSPAIDVVTS